MHTYYEDLTFLWVIEKFTNEIKILSTICRYNCILWEEQKYEMVIQTKFSRVDKWKMNLKNEKPLLMGNENDFF